MRLRMKLAWSCGERYQEFAGRKTNVSTFNGLDMGLGSLPRLSRAKTLSISAENPTGEKGKGGMATEGPGASCAHELGQGWKIAPYLSIKGKASVTLADIAGPGTLQHLWCTTPPSVWRSLILKIYWDEEETPSVCAPLGDFFCNGWGEPVNVSSLPVVVNPRGGFNSYWPMPFRKAARVMVDNLAEEDTLLYFQLNYTLTEVEDAAYFHAQWRRTNPLKYKEVYTIVDAIQGHGHYVGTYLAWQVNSNRWWGEGEIKFYLDGDRDFPTICGTGTEDYFGGAWNWEQPQGQYGTYSTPFLGMHQVIKPNGLYEANQRFGMYRWHVMDPIRFEEELRVTIQALGWRPGFKRYLPLRDDIASVAYWYQAEPHQPFPPLPSKDELEVV